MPQTAPAGKERRVFMYRQSMDELPVVGSSFRVMTEGDPEGGPAEVTYVAGRVATRPAGGLAEPVVTPAEALAAAQAHERGRELELWSEPELVAIYDDAPVGDGVGFAVWRVSGASERGVESWSFYVDAVTGLVVRDHSNIAHFADEVEGTVTGNATPGTKPDTFPETSGLCPNDPIGFNLPDVWVEAYDANAQLVDSGWTGAAGGYSCGDSAGRFCYADCDGSGGLDFFDFLCFQNLFAAADPAADCNGDGEFTFFDFLCFQNAFAGGCP